MRFSRGIGKFILVLVGILIGATCIYMMVDLGNYKELLSMYNNLGTSGSASSKVNFKKQLDKINVYTNEDGELVITLGGSSSTPDNGNVENTGGSSTADSGSGYGTPFNSLDLKSQISELQNNSDYNNGYYKSYIKTHEYKGHTFVWERQAAGAWSSYVPNTASMSGAGCFYYATSALIGAIQGKVYTIEKLLTDLGGSVTHPSGTFKVSGSPISSLDGSISMLNKCLSKSGCNNQATQKNKIDEQKLLNGEVMYIIYATKDNGSSTRLYSTSGQGMHWTCIVGAVNRGGVVYYLVLGNGDRGVEIEASNFNKLKYYFEVPIK